MSKKILAMILSMAVCLSFAACGDDDDDDSSKKSKSKDSSVSAADDSNEDESKEDDSKADESSEEESKKDESSEEESKKDESSEDESSEDESSEDESSQDESKEDPAPTGDGEWVTGTGYKVFVGSNWVNYDKYKEQVEAAMKEAGKSIGITAPLNIETCFYHDDDDYTDGTPCFNVVKPTKNSLFKSVKLKDLESQLTNSLKSQFSSIAGASVESKGMVKVGGADALLFEAKATVNDISLKSRQYVVLNGEYLYNFTFSVPEKDFDGLDKEMEDIIKSVTFTEA